MDAAVKAWLLSQVGETTDAALLADYEARYTRLGTARSVAIEVISGRLATLRAQPSTINVSSVIAVGYAENIRAYERQLALLESGEPPAPDDPDTPDNNDTDNTLGLLYLIERPRR
jgi:hypothetical protein